MSDKTEQLIGKIFDKLESINLDVQLVKQDVGNIKKDVSKNTKDLEKHIEGVITNKERLDIEVEAREELGEKVGNVDKRVSKMERVHIWLGVSVKFLAGLAILFGVLKYIFMVF